MGDGVVREGKFKCWLGMQDLYPYQARLAVEYRKERGIVMAWNNTALYNGITIGSMIGGYVISNFGVLFPAICL